MSDKQYGAVTGPIEFDPETRDVNGKTVTQITVTGSGQVKVRVTLWPELGVPFDELKLGLLVAARGGYTTNTSQDGSKTFHNISATTLSYGGKVFASSGPGVARKPAASSEPAF